MTLFILQNTKCDIPKKQKQSVCNRIGGSIGLKIFHLLNRSDELNLMHLNLIESDGKDLK